MRLLVRGLIGIALCGLLLGLSLLVLLQPVFTSTVAGRVSHYSSAGLPRARMLEIAEQVRVFVAEPTPGASLPRTVDGRAGFDEPAVAHLRDVATVIRGAKVATAVFAIVVLVWVLTMLGLKRTGELVIGLRSGAVLSAALVVLAVLGALFSFEELFTLFHSLFFKAGTWTFEYDSLLIQTFPEPFWASAGAAWAGLVLLGAGGLWVGAWALDGARSARAAEEASRNKE